MLVVFKRKNQNNPQIAILDDPEVKKKIRLYFYDRFAKTYSKTISLKEISYLNQLYASDLMNRVHAADLETWESNQIQIDRLFKEAIKEQSSAAPKKPQR